MDIIDYINWMIFSNTPAAYISMLFTAVIILASLKEAFKGYKREAGKQLLHAAFAAVVIFSAYFITEVLIVQIKTLFDNVTVEDLIYSVEGSFPELQIDAGLRQALLAIDTDLLELAVIIPVSTVIAPILFYILYLLLKIVFKILFEMFAAMIEKTYEPTTKVFGTLIGLFEGIIVTSLVCLPIIAYGNLIGGYVDTLDETDTDYFNVGLVDFYENYAKPICDNPYFQVSKYFGADGMITDFATVDLGNGDVDLRKDLYSSLRVVTASTLIDPGINWNSLSSYDKNSIDKFVDTLEDSDAFKKITAGMLNTASDIPVKLPIFQVWKQNKLIDAIYDDLKPVFDTSTSENVVSDLNTINDVLFALSDSKILRSYSGTITSDELIELFSAVGTDNVSTISKINSALLANDRMSPVLTTITELSVALMAGKTALNEDSANLYHNVKVGVCDVLSVSREDFASDDEYIATIKSTLEFALVEINGLSVDDAALDRMASYYAKNLAGSDELSETDINQILLRFYDDVAI